MPDPRLAQAGGRLVPDPRLQWTGSGYRGAPNTTMSGMEIAPFGGGPLNAAQAEAYRRWASGTISPAATAPARAPVAQFVAPAAPAPPPRAVPVAPPGIGTEMATGTMVGRGQYAPPGGLDDQGWRLIGLRGRRPLYERALQDAVSQQVNRANLIAAMAGGR